MRLEKLFTIKTSTHDRAIQTKIQKIINKVVQQQLASTDCHQCIFCHIYHTQLTGPLDI